MAILEARGLFWWADEAIPERQFAPNSCVSGVLKIEDDGSTFLELDGYLPSEHGPVAALVQREIPADTCIRGLLKGSTQQVLLIGLIHNGGQMTTNGISYERYISSICLVSERGDITDKLIFNQLNIPLSGYEEWLRLNAIKTARTPQTISIEYNQPENTEYHLTDGSLTFNFALEDRSSSSSLFTTELSVKETASVSLLFDSPIDLEGIKTQYQLFEDLLIVLTNTNYGLDWPSTTSANKARFRLYFRKLRIHGRTTEAPRYFECVANFIQLRSTFGTIWESWLKKREELGPGLYLYLGTRRKMTLYVEHLFVNLIWGIETFHRRKYSCAPSTTLKEKVQRILVQVSNSKDRKWLSKRLENAHEPSLGERIFKTFSCVPLDLDAMRLRIFSDRCAALRNDLSHFGGQRDKDGQYDNFITELSFLSKALSTLYQMLLLYELGIEENILRSWFCSHAIKGDLVKVGLLDETAVYLKPPGSKSLS